MGILKERWDDLITRESSFLTDFRPHAAIPNAETKI